LSEADDKLERINQRIAESQERLQRGSEALPALPQSGPLPDAYPPEDYRSLAAEYPFLTLAAGAGLGMLAGALLPKRFGARFGKHALSAAAVAAEIGLALSKQARDKAGEKAAEGLSQLDDRTAPLRQRAGRAAGSARSGARSAGAAIAREAIRLAMRKRP
jgi:hypothetical protein